MVKPKGRKKPFPGSDSVLRTESRASNDAADDPGGSPVLPEIPNLDSEIGVIRRSLKLHLIESGTLRNDSDQNTNDFVLTGSA